MNKNITVIVFLLLAGGITGCGVFHHHKGTKPATDSTTIAKADSGKVLKATDTSIVKATTDSIILNKPKTDTAIVITISPEKKRLINNLAFLWAQPFSFTTFDGKAKMSYGNKDFAANFKVKKDSAIWISVTGSALGITLQVARILITPDSFKLVNYLQREATVMSLKEAAKLLPTPMDFSSLQNFITGQPLRSSGTITDATDSTGIWALQVMDSAYLQSIKYSKADSNMQLSYMNTIKPNGPKGVIHYSNYTLADGRRFSRNRVMNIDNAGKQYIIEMNFVNQEFDKPQDITFSIPSNYPVNK